MKHPSMVSWFAIGMSGAALILHWTEPEPLSPSQIEAAVDASLIKREREVVERNTAAFREMLAELGTLESPNDWSPETLEELFAPLVRIVSDMGSP